MRWNARAKSSNDLFAFFLHGIKGSLSKYKVICTQGTDRLRRSMPRVWKSTLFLGCFHCNRLSFLPCLSRFPTGLLRGPSTLFPWSSTWCLPTLLLRYSDGIFKKDPELCKSTLLSIPLIALDERNRGEKYITSRRSYRNILEGNWCHRVIWNHDWM